MIYTVLYIRDHEDLAKNITPKTNLTITTFMVEMHQIEIYYYTDNQYISYKINTDSYIDTSLVLGCI